MRTKIFRPVEPAAVPATRPRGRRASLDSVAVLRALCLRIGVPVPVAEHRFHPSRKWRFDFAWPDYKVGLEKEGGIFARKNGKRGAHGSVTGILRDIEKYSEAAACGWLVIRTRADQWPSSVALERVKRAMLSRDIRWTRGVTIDEATANLLRGPR